MAITARTLSVAMTRSDLVAVLDSATGTADGNTMLIGTEYMQQVGAAVSTTVTVRRGLLGSAQLPHAVSSAVSTGLGSDFTPPFAFRLDGTTLDVSSTTGALEVISGSEAPATATYITQTSNSLLPNSQVLASLSTGLVKVTTTTGALTAVT